jgi:RimJ/RimL family protein N-acetyltransferase
LRYGPIVEAVVHSNVAEFWAVSRDYLRADPVWHTVPITVVDRRLHFPEVDGLALLLVSLHEGGEVRGVAVQAPPWPVAASGIPVGTAELVASTFADLTHDVPGVSGPRAEAEAFARAWAERSGVQVHETMAMRLYRLGDLVPPDVPGEPRLATESDIAQLARWRTEFIREAMPDIDPAPSAEDAVRRTFAAGQGQVVWQVDGEPVSWAVASRPAVAMSRIGPVYTPPEYRRHGYGAAVAAAMSRWALDAGAQDVVLYTDLANPVSNSVYRRIGYRAVCDSVELTFTSPS